MRAKARKERWEEEVKLVKKEMEWTINCFRYHEREWKERAERVKGEGHRAYAWKQSSTWAEWAGRAGNAFKRMEGS